MNGIGGNTIAEVKANLTMFEVRQWMEYRNRRGSLNIARRVEQAVGSLMALYYNSKASADSETMQPIEFMPNEDDIVEEYNGITQTQ